MSNLVLFGWRDFVWSHRADVYTWYSHSWSARHRFWRGICALSSTAFMSAVRALQARRGPATSNSPGYRPPAKMRALRHSFQRVSGAFPWVSAPGEPLVRGVYSPRENSEQLTRASRTRFWFYLLTKEESLSHFPS